MDKKTLSIVLGLVLITSFFLPLYKIGGSALDAVKNAGSAPDPIVAYLFLVFPISGLMLLIGALNNNNYPGGRSIWTWLPLLTILFLLILYPVIKGVSIGNVFKGLGKFYGIGLWLMIVGSILAAFVNPRSK